MHVWLTTKSIDQRVSQRMFKVKKLYRTKERRANTIATKYRRVDAALQKHDIFYEINNIRNRGSINIQERERPTNVNLVTFLSCLRF